MWCGNIFEEQYVRNTMQPQQNPMPGRQPVGTNGYQNQSAQQPPQYQYQQQGQMSGNQSNIGQSNSNRYVQQPQQRMPGGDQSYPNQYSQQSQQRMPGGDQSYPNQYSQQSQQRMSGGRQGLRNPYLQQAETNEALPMNWYNFVVKVQYILAIIVNAVVIEQLLLQGGVFTSREAQKIMYGFSKGFLIIDILYGALTVISCFLCVWVRQKLVQFQKDAWKWYIGYLCFNLLAGVLYYICLAILYSSLELEASVFGSRIGSSLVVSGVCIALNYIYFNKRKHLFVN